MNMAELELRLRRQFSIDAGEALVDYMNATVVSKLQALNVICRHSICPPGACGPCYDDREWQDEVARASYGNFCPQCGAKMPGQHELSCMYVLPADECVDALVDEGVNVPTPPSSESEDSRDHLIDDLSRQLTEMTERYSMAMGPGSSFAVVNHFERAKELLGAGQEFIDEAVERVLKARQEREAALEAELAEAKKDRDTLRDRAVEALQQRDRARDETDAIRKELNALKDQGPFVRSVKKSPKSDTYRVPRAKCITCDTELSFRQHLPAVPESPEDPPGPAFNVFVHTDPCSQGWVCPAGGKIIGANGLVRLNEAPMP
jgi:hypothetical protein